MEEQSRFFALIPFLFALGIAFYFALPTEPNMWIALGVFEIWLLLFYIFRHQKIHLLFISGIIIWCGFADIMLKTTYQSKRVETVYKKKFTYLRGQIIDIIPNNKGKQRLVLTNAADYDMPLKGNFRVTLNVKETPLKVNDCVEMIATLFPRRPLPILHGFQSDFDYFYKGLSAIGYANSEVFKISCPSSKIKLLSRINQIRQKISDKIAAILPPSEAGVADALLIGNKSYIASEIADNYRNSGLAHFLSVSGLHMGTITGLLFFALRFLLALLPTISLRFDIKKIAAIGAILGSVAYLLISGLAIPAIRAFIMTTVVFIGIIFQRQAISLRMVSFAAIVILVIMPQSLASVSFQMSFAAVYALVAFYEVYKQRFSERYKHGFVNIIFLYFAGVLAGDFIASLATAPIALYHFHRLAIYTSLTNILAAPIIAFWIIPMVLLCLITMPWELALYPLSALGKGIMIINKITAFVAALPHSVLVCNRMNFTAFVLIVCGGYWLCIWQRKWRKWGLFAIIGAIMLMLLPIKKPDIVFSVNAQQVAVRDLNGDLILLPLMKDNWLTNIWLEQLDLKIPNKNENAKIYQAMFENGNMPENLPLKCDGNKCIYKDKVVISSQNIIVGGIKIDTSDGGYIYVKDQPSWLPLWKSSNRLWKQKIDLLQ